MTKIIFAPVSKEVTFCPCHDESHDWVINGVSHVVDHRVSLKAGLGVGHGVSQLQSSLCQVYLTLL